MKKKLLPNVWLITGKQNSGKTVMILEIVKLAKSEKLSICGLVSPGIYKNGERIAISVLNLETEQQEVLADLKPGWDMNYPAKKWKMCEKAVQWGEKQLENIDAKNKIFFLDEVGVYEILNGKGWQTGLKLLRQKQYQKAFICVRKEIVTELIKICEIEDILYTVIDLDDPKIIKQVIIQEIEKILRENC